MLSRLFMGIMIEFCTPRRMIVTIAILLTVSIIVVVIGNSMSSDIPEPKDTTVKTAGSETVSQETQAKCWEEENFSVIEECTKCTYLQLSKLNSSYCTATGYYEQVLCESKKRESRSCPKVGWMEARPFWIFETVTLAVGLVSYTIVFFRQKLLDQQLMDKVNKQIGAGL